MNLVDSCILACASANTHAAHYIKICPSMALNENADVFVLMHHKHTNNQEGLN